MKNKIYFTQEQVQSLMDRLGEIPYKYIGTLPYEIKTIAEQQLVKSEDENKDTE